MANQPTVDKRRKTKVLSVRYPLDRAKLLEAVKEKRGDGTLNETITAALDRFIEAELSLPMAA